MRTNLHQRRTDAVIPTLMLAGFVTGLLSGPWRLLGGGAFVVAWPLLPIWAGADADPTFVLGAIAFAAGNTGLGVFAAQKSVAAARVLARLLRDGHGPVRPRAVAR